MSMLNGRVRVLSAVALGGLSLTGCATRGYVDERIAEVNTRIDALDQRVTTASQRADAAAQSAAQANQAAQAAATDARSANQRVDQLTGRVDQLEKAPARTPRG